eukprot:scaffold23675_cov108-Cylindrotheca_fusiformis.AAC.7
MLTVGVSLVLQLDHKSEPSTVHSRTIKSAPLFSSNHEHLCRKNESQFASSAQTSLQVAQFKRQKGQVQPPQLRIQDLQFGWGTLDWDVGTLK